IVGFEVGFDIFRFFGSNLWDVNLGAKNMEPLQLGVRIALEQGVLDLIGAVTQVDPTSCLDKALDRSKAQAKGQPVPEQTAPAVPETLAIAPAPAPMPISQATNAGPTTEANAYQVSYE